jgi:hypothetical protein
MYSALVCYKKELYLQKKINSDTWETDKVRNSEVRNHLHNHNQHHFEP